MSLASGMEVAIEVPKLMPPTEIPAILGCIGKASRPQSPKRGRSSGEGKPPGRSTPSGPAMPAAGSESGIEPPAPKLSGAMEATAI